MNPVHFTFQTVEWNAQCSPQE